MSDREIEVWSPNQVKELMETNIKWQGELFSSEIRGLTTLLNERNTTQTTALQAALSATERASNLALTAQKDATSKAEIETNKRFETITATLNTLASYTDKSTGIYATHDSVADALNELRRSQEMRDGALDQKLAPVFEFVSGQKAARLGSKATWAGIYGAVIATAAIITGIYYLLPHK
jgi:hypothetical protein